MRGGRRGGRSSGRREHFAAFHVPQFWPHFEGRPHPVLFRAGGGGLRKREGRPQDLEQAGENGEGRVGSGFHDSAARRRQGGAGSGSETTSGGRAPADKKRAGERHGPRRAALLARSLAAASGPRERRAKLVPGG